jgi:hypothetical protein
MTDLTFVPAQSGLDALLPATARRYLEHTTEGRPIREIAREAGCHASTILRQVRKLETQRDDPLVDQLLGGDTILDDPETDAARLEVATDALRQLCEPRAILIYSDDLPKPAIVKTVGQGETMLLAAVDVDLAAALVLRNWIDRDGGTSVKRYRVTQEGRSALPRLVAAREARALQRADGGLPDVAQSGPDRRSRNRPVSTGPGSESPLTALARRRGPDGKPFLPPGFVLAGDRLYEDYVLAGVRTSDLLGWDSPEALQPHYDNARSLQDNRRRQALLRTLDAVSDLGPSLSEVALRCCCLREGLEATEKRLGWSARSGKVVLRIALQRLDLFYSGARAKECALIG